MSPATAALVREEATTILRDGTALHVRTWGDGFPLLLLHGLGMSSALWVHQVPAFAVRYRTIAMDLRGFGRSDRPVARGAYAIEEMARDAAAVLAALGVERAHVLGTSMGGFIAQTLALAQPALCESLVLCHSAARMSIPADLIASRLAVLRSATMRAYGELVAEQALAANAGAELRAWLVDLVARNDPRAYEQVLVEGLSAFDVGERVGALRAPTLVVVGEQDRVIPAEEGRALARRIPGAELCEIACVGHIGYAERPAAFNAAVLRFLARVDADARG